jgi:hypothetical protein
MKTYAKKEIKETLIKPLWGSYTPLRVQAP